MPPARTMEEPVAVRNDALTRYLDSVEERGW